MSIVPNEPTFYLNDLAGTANVDVSGIRTINDIDDKPITTYAPVCVINSIQASEAQTWFKFVGGKSYPADIYNDTYTGDVMYGVKSNAPCSFTDIPSEGNANTTVKYYQYNLQSDYLGTLSTQVFGYPEGADLFSNVAAIKTNYNVALKTATKSTNDVMNDIVGTIVTVNGEQVDISKKLANTIMTKHPERYELKFGAQIVVNPTTSVPNGHLGYLSGKTPGKQTTSDWFVYSKQAETSVRSYEKAVVKVTLSDQNTIDDIVLTKEGNGYQSGETLILCKYNLYTSPSDHFITFPSILDIQATTLNNSLNLEDILFSTTDVSGNGQNQDHQGTNPYITNRLFLPNVTIDASLVCIDVSGTITGTGAHVDISCNSKAEFLEMYVTKRSGDKYDVSNTLLVSKNNATIRHILTQRDAVRLNLGVLDISSASIDSSGVFNTDSSGGVVSTNSGGTGTGAIVSVWTSNSDTDVSNVLVDKTGSGYSKDDIIRITNIDNIVQTIDISLTLLDANRLNGVVILDLSGSLLPEVTTRSIYTSDETLSEIILCSLEVSGNNITYDTIVEVDASNNGTWIKRLIVRDGSGNQNQTPITTDNTIILTNINKPNETITMVLSQFDASFTEALNNGEEFILLDTSSNSLVDSSNSLTNSLTGGIVFMNARSNNVMSIKTSNNTLYDYDTCGNQIIYKSGGTGGYGAVVDVVTEQNGNLPYNKITSLTMVSPIDKSDNTHRRYADGDKILIQHNYQTLTKNLSLEDAALLNGDGNEINGLNNIRTITSNKIFTDGAFGYATIANMGPTDGSGALIRVDTSNNDTALVTLTVMIPDASNKFIASSAVTITNIYDPTQRVTFTLDATPPAVSVSSLSIKSNQINELNAPLHGNTVLDICGNTDIPFLFRGGITKNVRAVKNGVDNKYSEAIVDIACDGSGNDVGTIIQSITLVNPAQPGTVGSDGKLYYDVGDTITFTVDESGNSINRVGALNQTDTNVPITTITSNFNVKYVITLKSLTKEQSDLLNGIMVGTCVPLLPGDILAIKSTISSPDAPQDEQPLFKQSFLTHYVLR
jgi:hypothetical protein